MNEAAAQLKLERLTERINDRGFKVSSVSFCATKTFIFECRSSSRGIKFIYRADKCGPCSKAEYEGRTRMLFAWLRFVIRRIDQIDGEEEFGGRLK
jgi:hypothetical protein